MTMTPRPPSKPAPGAPIRKPAPPAANAQPAVPPNLPNAMAAAKAAVAAKPSAAKRSAGKSPDKTSKAPDKTSRPAKRAATATARVRAAFRPRLLPLTIFAAVLMLGARMGNLWQAVTADEAFEAVQPTLAQSTRGSSAPARVAEAPAEPAAPNQPAGQPAAAPSAPATQPENPARPGNPKDRVGPAELELLQHLGERRTELDRRAKDIEQREALLVAAEARFDQKVAELQKIREEIQGLLRQVDEKQQAQLESLVKIYETMKPKEAARIFETMDMPVLLNVIERMKESKSAPILASMDPLKAKEVTIALADRRQLPQMPTQ